MHAVRKRSGKVGSNLSGERKNLTDSVALVLVIVHNLSSLRESGGPHTGLSTVFSQRIQHI